MPCSYRRFLITFVPVFVTLWVGGIVATGLVADAGWSRQAWDGPSANLQDEREVLVFLLKTEEGVTSVSPTFADFLQEGSSAEKWLLGDSSDSETVGSIVIAHARARAQVRAPGMYQTSGGMVALVYVYPQSGLAEADITKAVELAYRAAKIEFPEPNFSLEQVMQITEHQYKPGVDAGRPPNIAIDLLEPVQFLAPPWTIILFYAVVPTGLTCLIVSIPVPRAVVRGREVVGES